MADVTFPTARKVVLYVINGKLYTKLGEREAKANPVAIRGLLNDKLAWFMETAEKPKTG